MRLFSVFLALALAVSVAPASGQAASQTDYAVERAAFKTKLTRQRPAPQSYREETPPAGIDQITYTSGALALKAWLGKPSPTAEKMPVVIFLHGGFAFSSSDFRMAEPYRQAGFVVMTPILRGENGQPGAYSLFYNEVDDVLAAADYIRAQDYVDPERIYLAGHSVGGTLAMLSALTSNKFAAVATLSGSPNQMLWMQGLSRNEIPFDPSNAREIEMRSPIAFPGSVKAPLRVYYGDREAIFAATSPSFVERASAAGRDVSSKVFPGDHFSYVPAAIADSIAFFNEKR